MKKVFWTSVVRIVLFALFLLYIKWFNQPLAQWISDFVLKWEKNIETNVWEIDLNLWDDDILEELIQNEVDEVEILDVLEEEKINLYEQKNWEILFKQLDRMEVLISSLDLEPNVVEEKTETTEDIFDEFKTRYEKNRK